jgi:hypothetical protein
MPGVAQPHQAKRCATAASPDALIGEAPGQSDARATARVVGDPVADPTATTLKLYAGDWARFVAWCREQGCPALPASSETLARVCFTDRPFGSEDLTQ